MSLSYSPLKCVLVRDNRLMLESIRTCAVLKGGSNVNYQQFKTNNVSSTSITFSTPPPSTNVVVDRKIFVSLPIRLSLTGICPNTETLIMPSRDGPRAFPISSSIESLNVAINQQQLNVNLADIINPLMHYNTDSKDKNGSWSATPTYQDQSGNYDALYMNSRNPLGTYGDTCDGNQIGRGAFPYKIIANPVCNGVNPVTVVIDILFTETIYMSPFNYGTNPACGFYNLSTLEWNFNFVSTMWARIWSHSTRGSVANITSGNVVFGGMINGPDGGSFPSHSATVPTMLLQFVTGTEDMVLPTHPLTYPYGQMTRYPTTFPSCNPGASSTETSGLIQLNQIPSRMYIYVGEERSDLCSNPSKTDTFFQINNISMNFLTTQGIFSTATMQQLYEISKKNGCQLNYVEWSGGPTFKTNSFDQISTVGSVFCCTPMDFGLPSSLAPSVLCNTQVQIQITYTNTSDRVIRPCLYLIVINQGSLTLIPGGASRLNMGIITQNDVLDVSQTQVGIPQSAVTEFVGGDFWSSLRDFGNRISPYIQKIHDWVKDNKVLSTGLSMVPANLPYGIGRAAQLGSVGARALGYGNGGNQGDIVLGAGNAGGQQLSRQELRRRMQQY